MGTSQNKAKFEDYEGFVEKFKPKRTTDDCYTPPKVYDAVLSFVGTLADTANRPVVRPFYPGGDYEHFDYPERCIVVDNPPFSIYSKIVRFYLEKGIDFFLFAPQLTVFVNYADCSYIITNSSIIYENGANVNTAFVTNLLKDIRIWLCPELGKALTEAQAKDTPVLSKNTYPMHVVSSAIMGKIVRQGVELKIRKDECLFVSNLDSLRAEGKKIFGNAFLLSERAAAERAAAERAAGSIVQLSPRELELIKTLG